jgi:hypothetical protein
MEWEVKGVLWSEFEIEVLVSDVVFSFFFVQLTDDKMGVDALAIVIARCFAQRGCTAALGVPGSWDL